MKSFLWKIVPVFCFGLGFFVVLCQEHSPIGQNTEWFPSNQSSISRPKRAAESNPCLKHLYSVSDSGETCFWAKGTTWRLSWTGLKRCRTVAWLFRLHLTKQVYDASLITVATVNQCRPGLGVSIPASSKWISLIWNWKYLTSCCPWL